MAKDTKMYHIENDIDKIKLKTNQYIHEYGSAGTFHLVREIVQNAFDECLDEDSSGNKIEMSYDIATGIFKTEDNGRGFPETDYPMNIFVEKIQSGSKFYRESGTATAGEFGVGLTVCNALSDLFRISSYREDEGTVHTLEYSLGELKSDTMKKSKGKHGCITEIKVSSKFMGDDCDLNIDEVINWVDDLFHLNSEQLKKRHISSTLTVYDGLELISVHKFKPMPFEELLNRIIPAGMKKDDMSHVCSFSRETNFVEDSKVLKEEDGNSIITTIPIKRLIHMDFAFRYCVLADMNDTANYDTYCNYTNTVEHGTHLDVFDDVYCRYIQAAVNNSMSDMQKSKLQVKWDDIRTNLFCVINLSTSAAVGFVGNAKQKISAEQLVPYMKELVTDGLNEYFDNKKDHLDTIIKIVKINAKARQEAAKAKAATQTEKINTLKEHQMSNFIRCNNKGKQFKEICVVEGNSAAGSVRNGRNADTTAVFLLRGVTLNPIKRGSLADVMANAELNKFVTVLRCGIGQKFDINKLYYNRICILTDSDVDGNYITAGVLAFFYKFYRPIIEAGLLYKIYAPLYKIDNKDNPFVINKAEMVNIYQKEVVKCFKIRPAGDDDWLTKNELYEFLMDTYEYADIVVNASEALGKINKFFVEIVIAYLVLFNKVRSDTDFDNLDELFTDQKFISQYMNKVQGKFKEVSVNEHGRLFGVIEGRTCIIKVNKRFIRKVSDIIPVFLKYGYELEVKEKGKDEIKKMSILEFIDLSMKLYPKILSRFKGLGELNGDQLYKSVLDINNRISIQYTVDDVERELAIFEMMHGNSKKNIEDRKNIMRQFKIKRDDLDN